MVTPAHERVLKSDSDFDLWRYCRICGKSLKSSQKFYCCDAHRREGNLIEATIRKAVRKEKREWEKERRKEIRRIIREKANQKKIERKAAKVKKDLSELSERKKAALEEGDYPAATRIEQEARAVWEDKDNPLRPKRSYGERESTRPIPTKIECPNCGSVNLKRTKEIVCMDCGTCLGYEYAEWIPFDIVNQRKDSAVIKAKEEKGIHPL